MYWIAYNFCQVYPKYWPSEGSKNFGQFVIESTSNEVFQDFSERELTIFKRKVHVQVFENKRNKSMMWFSFNHEEQSCALRGNSDLEFIERPWKHSNNPLNFFQENRSLKTCHIQGHSLNISFRFISFVKQGGAVIKAWVFKKIP